MFTRCCGGRDWGGRAGVRPQTRILIQGLLCSLKNTRLLQPAAAYGYYAVGSTSSGHTLLDNNRPVHRALLPVALSEARELAIVLITIGPRLEKQVTRYSKGGDVTRAAILDDIGSTAADMAVADVRRRLAKQVTSRGYELSSPVSPGMPGFPLTEQRHLLQLAGAAKIGVAVTASGVFVPRK
jgi:hypothetical protein